MLNRPSPTGQSGSFGATPANQSYSTRLGYNSQLGSLVRDGPPPVDRPYGNVGKFDVNLLHMGDQTGFNPDTQSMDYAYPGETKLFTGTPLTTVDDYFAQSGGLIAGLAGALGSAVGGIFGQGGAAAGAQIGSTIGKITEAPLAVAGSLPLPGAVGQMFLSPEQREQIAGAGKGSLFEGSLLSGEGAMAASSSVGGAFMSATTTLGLLGRFVERTVAGAADSGNGPLLGFMGRDMPDKYKQMVATGQLTEDQALDQMVLDGAGYSDDMMLNIVASVVLDPVNLLSLGTGLAIKATGATVKVSEALNVAGRLGRAEDLTGELGELQKVARSYQMQGKGLDLLPEDLSSRSRLAAAVNEVSPATRSYGTQADAFLQLGRMERLGLGIFGPVQPGSMVGNVARKADTFINLGLNKLFGHENMPMSAAAAYKHTTTAVTHGYIAGLGSDVVEHMAQAADRLTPGGRGLIEDSIAVGAANKRNEVMLDMQISDGMKSNRVPVVDGATPGTHLTPYDAVQGVLKRSPFQRDIGKHVELLTERDKPNLYAEGRSIEQVQQDTYAKFAEMTNSTVDDAARELGGVDERLAQAVHASYYYRKGQDLQQKVIPLLKSMPVSNLPRSLRGAGFVDRLTSVGSRTLTNVRAKAIEDAIKANDIPRLRDLAFGYREFDNLTESMTDADLLAYMDEWMKAHKGTLLTEIPLHDPKTGAPIPLPGPLADWAKNSDTMGYRLALAPPEGLPGEVLYRATRDKNGVLTSMRPWMPFEAERLESAALPNRWERLHMQALRGIRQERINWTNRRRFVTEMATGSQRGGVDIPPRIGQRMFDAIMVRAQETNVQPRGLAPSAIVEASRSVLRDKEFLGAMRGTSISDTQLLMGTLKAFSGDLRQVGVTQKITGGAKVRLPGAGRNMWGQISENLYPLMRFTVNPVFLGMELVEPYILGAMRGITVPLRKGEDGYQQSAATHEATERLLRSGLNPEGSQLEQADKLALMRQVGSFAHQRYGRTSVLGRLTDKIAPGDIQRRKSVAMAMQTEKTFGYYMKQSMQSIMGDQFDTFWRGLQEHFHSVDDGEISMRWAMENLAFTDADGTRITHVSQLLNPANIGQRKRFTLAPTAGAMTYRDLADTIDQAMIAKSTTKNLGKTFAEQAEDENVPRLAAGLAPLDSGQILHDRIRSGQITRQEVHDLFNDLGLNNSDQPGVASNADNLWLHATGLTAEEYERGWRESFAQTVHGANAQETRAIRDIEINRIMAMIRAKALTMGITDDEYIRTHWQPSGVFRERALAPGVAPTPLSQTVSQPLFEQRVHWRRAVSTIFRHNRDRIDAGVAGEISRYAHPALEEALAKDTSNDYIYFLLRRSKAEDFHSQYHYAPSSELPAIGYPPQAFLDPATAPMHDLATHEPLPYAGNYTVARIAKDDLNPGDFEFDDGKYNPTGLPSYSMKTWGQYVWTGEVHPTVETFSPANDWTPFTRTHDAGGGRGVYDTPRPEDIALVDQPYDMAEEILQADGRAYPPALDQAAKEHMSTGRQREVSSLWEGNTYAEINTYKRGLTHVGGMTHTDDELEEMSLRMDQMVRRSQLPVPTTLHRGINVSRAEYEFKTPGARDILDLKPGDTYSDLGYTAWSGDEAQTGLFSTHRRGTPDGVLQEGVVLHWDAPAGSRFHMIGNHENEHVFPREKPWTVTARREEWGMDSAGRPEVVVHYDVIETPGMGGSVYGVKRMLIEDPAPLETVPGQTLATATIKPEILRIRAGHPGAAAAAGTTPEATIAHTEALIARTEAAKPKNAAIEYPDIGYVGPRTTSEQVINDLTRDMSDDEIMAAARGPNDFAERLRDLMFAVGDTGAGDHALPVVAHFIAQNGRAGLDRLLSFFEDLSSRLEFSATPSAAGLARLLDDEEYGLASWIAKGNVPAEGVRGLTHATSDMIDVLSGNVSRRVDGRATGLEPVVVDADTMRGAGYLTHTDIHEIEYRTGQTQRPPGKFSPGLDQAQRRVQRASEGYDLDTWEPDQFLHSFPDAMTGPPGTIRLLNDDSNWFSMRSWVYVLYDQSGDAGAVVRMHGPLTPSGVRPVLPDHVDGLVVASTARGQGLASKLYDHIQDSTGVNLYPMVGQDNSDAGLAFVTRWLDKRKATEEEAITRAFQPGPSPTGLVADDLTDTDAVHEHVVAFYNRLKNAWNDKVFMGRNDWTAAEAAAVVGHHEHYYRLGSEAIPLEAKSIEDSINYMPAQINPGPLTKRGRAMMAPLYDLLAEPSFRPELHSFHRETSAFDARMLLDNLNTTVGSMLDESLGHWGNAEQALTGVNMFASREMARNAADLMAVTRYRDNFSTFERVVDPTIPKETLTPRLHVVLEGGHNSNIAITLAEGMAKTLGLEGVSTHRMANGDALIRFIDTNNALPRAANGEVIGELVSDMILNASEKAKQSGIQYNWWPTPKWDVHYGETYLAQPPRFPGGKVDWAQFPAVVARSLTSRGLDGWTEQRVRDLVTEATEQQRSLWKRVAPKQYDRAYRGEPVVPGVLEERRFGTVHGSTEFDADHRAVTRAFGAADPVTGLHELFHVFATDLNESQRGVIMKARADALLRHRTDTQARIDEYRAKGDAAKTNRTKAKWYTKADALQHDLGELVDETPWGVEHEEFFVSQAQRWFKTGTLDAHNVGNTELVAAFEHFRNWMNNMWQAVQGKRDPTQQISPEMNKLFNDMFNGKPPVETASYSVTEQALRMAAYQNLGAAFDEAFQTQQYKRDRGMLERSLNHPYIGLYPLSYMWGKVLPEMIAFLALNPFGMKTPMLGWNVGREISDTVRSRSESDPAFAQWMSDNKEMFQLWSMIFPALPQEIPANVSLPVRRIAEQGLEAEEAARVGKKVNPIDWSKGLSDAVTYAVGPLGTLRMGTENLPGALSTLFFGSEESRKAAAKKAFEQSQHVQY